MTPRPTVVSWSSGKDSTMALHVVRQDPSLKVVTLLSTFSESADRVAIHGTRRAVARAQAAALGLPLIEVDLPDRCPNVIYEERLGGAVRRLVAEGVRDWIFGDLFLEDIRAYREAQMAPFDLRLHFPIWGRDTAALAREMLDVGIDARIASLDLARLPVDLCGRCFDLEFLETLPQGVDPCGERGEFHTIVTDSPDFAYPIPLRLIDKFQRNDFVYADFALSSSSSM